MNLAITPYAVSVQDYLAGEPHGLVRHEYVSGQVYAMAGASERHNRIAGNLFFHLRAATRGTPCAVFIHDMKLRILHQDSFYYPDVMTTCHPRDTQSLYKEYPSLVVEVLSPSTEVIDRREKLIAYRNLASMRHYLIVWQEEKRVEWHSRNAQDGWGVTVLDGSGHMDIALNDLHIQLSPLDVYEDVKWL